MYTCSAYILLIYIGSFLSNYVYAQSKYLDAKYILHYTTSEKCKQDFDYPSFDGWFHNLAKPAQGSVGENIITGWNSMHMNTIRDKQFWKYAISDITMCRKNTTALTLLHARFLAFEVFKLKESTTSSGDFLLKKDNLNINYATAYIDGDSIYGTKKYSDLERFVEKDGKISLLFLFQQPSTDYSLIWLKLIWIRWHNSLAEVLFEKCPKLGKQALFNEARKFTIGTLQNVYAYDWLPQWTGQKLSSYKRYDPLIDPQIEKLFQAAIYLPQELLEVYSFKYSGKGDGIATLEIQLLHAFRTLDNRSCKEYEKYANDLQIHSIWPDINYSHKIFKLPFYDTLENFDQENNVTYSKELCKYYKGRLEQLDALSGGLLESKNGSGKLFSTILHEQFRRFRDGDRLWFENLQNALFTSQEVGRLKNIKFSDVLYAGYESYSIKNETLLKQKSLKQEVSFSYEKFLCYLLFGYLTTLPLMIITCIFVRKKKITQKTLNENDKILKKFQQKYKIRSKLFIAQEYGNINLLRHKVVLVLDKLKKQVVVYTLSGFIFRVLIVNDIQEIRCFHYKRIVIIKSALSYDLIVAFENVSRRSAFIKELGLFLRKEINQKNPSLIIKTSIKIKSFLSRKQYQILLEKMFRVIFAQAFKIKHSQQEILDVDSTFATKVQYCKLTVFEFSECLGINPEGKFASQIFSLLDRHNEGFICFRQFLDLIILFVTGTVEKKATLFFKLYDIDGIDSISRHGFKIMLSSFLSIVADVFEPDVATSLIREANYAHRENLALRHFLKVVANYLHTLSRASLDVNKSTSDKSYLSVAAKTLSSLYKKDNTHSSQVFEFAKSSTHLPLNIKSHTSKILKFFENYSSDLFYVTFSMLTVFFLTVYYGYEHYKKSDIHRTIEILMAVCKASSYGIVLTYAIIIITCCRNIFYHMESVHIFIPIHCLSKIRTCMVYLSALLAVIHLCGYGLVSYKLSLCTSYGTIENEELWNLVQLKVVNPILFSGVILFLIFASTYLIVLPCIRKILWTFLFEDSIVFSFYLVVSLLFVVHCSLSEKSLLLGILPGPAIIFVINYFIGIQKLKPCSILDIKEVPSNVLCITLKRPNNFNYKSGQWIALLNDKNASEDHRMFLSSASIEPNLRIYVSLKDPYAHELRNTYQNVNSNTFFISGPYGKGLMHWQDFNISVLVCSGKGVGMFAPILEEILFVLKSGHSKDVVCKKIYFIWTTKSQENFEYIDDLLRHIEEIDQSGFFYTQLFITEAYENFNMRSIMTNICEEHFKRVSQRNVFTGLKTVTHFETPEFSAMFLKICLMNEWADRIGVISSGSCSFTNLMRRSLNTLNCKINQESYGIRFYHEIVPNIY